MRRTTRIALSIACGVAAAAIALVYVSGVRAKATQAQQEALERYGGDLTAVCVATRDIEPGESIDEGNTRVEEWVSSLLPEGALTSLRDALGKTATSSIPKRAPLSSTYFERQEGAIEVPKGTVAVSVASDEEHAVGGALTRGQQIDVYVTRDGVTDCLTDAEVLDTSALADGGGEVSWVTLAVDEDAVEELLTASGKGMVSLTMPAPKSKRSDGGGK